MPKKYAIIVAGGKGLRMGGEIPKQFVPLYDRPVLMHTLSKFASCDAIVLVLPQEQQSYWQELCRQYSFDLTHSIVSGGETRYHSVLSGLNYLQSIAIPSDSLIAVHDGVRPLVATSVIQECYAQAELYHAALPYRPITDSLRQLNAQEASSKAVNRSEYIAVHTPQIFRADMLLDAYTRGYKENFTDDASVWEDFGYAPPILVLSNEENIKLTTPIDLKLADLFLRK